MVIIIINFIVPKYKSIMINYAPFFSAPLNKAAVDTLPVSMDFKILDIVINSIIYCVVLWLASFLSCKVVYLPWKAGWYFFKSLNIELPYCSTILP